MSNRFHNKFHRENHHSVKNVKNQDHIDASYDPIASFDSPFQGEFYSEGDILTTENLSAQKYIYAQDGLIHNQFAVKSTLSAAANLIVDDNLTVGNNGTVQNNLTVKNILSAEGNSFFNSDAVFNGGVTIQGTLSVESDSVFDQNVLVKNNTNIQGILSANEGIVDTDLLVKNNLTVQNNLSVEVDATINNDLLVKNNTTLEGTLSALTDVTVDNDLFVKNNTTIQNILSVVNSSVIDVDLQVGRDVSVQGNLTIVGNLSTFGDATHIETTTYLTSSVEINNEGTGPALKVTQGGSEPIAHFIDSNGDDIIFSDNGYVGLGTDVPNEKLTVIGNISATGNLYLDGSTTVMGIISSSANLVVDGNTTLGSLSSTNSTEINGSLKVNSELATNSVTIDQQGTGNSFVIQNSANNKFVVTSEGLVGIGTDTPNKQLTVVGSISTTENIFVDGDQHVIGNSTITLNSYISGDNFIDGDLVVTSNAYVSGNQILDGTLTVSDSISSSTIVFAGSALQIDDDIILYKDSANTLKIDNNLIVGSLSSGLTDDVIIKDASNTLQTRVINSRIWDTTANFLSGSLTQNKLPKFDSNSSLIDSLIYDDGTFVGINTTSPTDTFTVAGSSKFFGNVTIFGDLTASGSSTFANTVFSTTSALSVVHIGSGPAAWIGNDGTGDIATFYDIDAGVEILHVGGNNSAYPNVGVKTGTPNVDFTVNGEISASESLYVGGSAVVGILTPGSTNTVVIHDTSNVLETRTINSKVWDTNANFLSGNLTQNYLTKFDNQSTLANSNIYDSGTLVGINTNTPNEELTVVGSVSATEGIFAQSGLIANRLTVAESVSALSSVYISDVEFTGATTVATSITASNTFIQVVIGGQIKYLRLFDVT